MIRVFLGCVETGKCHFMTPWNLLQIVKACMMSPHDNLSAGSFHYRVLQPLLRFLTLRSPRYRSSLFPRLHLLCYPKESSKGSGKMVPFEPQEKWHLFLITWIFYTLIRSLKKLTKVQFISSSRAQKCISFYRKVLHVIHWGSLSFHLLWNFRSFQQLMQKGKLGLESLRSWAPFLWIPWKTGWIKVHQDCSESLKDARRGE